METMWIARSRHRPHGWPQFDSRSLNISISNRLLKIMFRFNYKGFIMTHQDKLVAMLFLFLTSTRFIPRLGRRCSFRFLSRDRFLVQGSSDDFSRRCLFPERRAPSLCTRWCFVHHSEMINLTEGGVLSCGQSHEALVLCYRSLFCRCVCAKGGLGKKDVRASGKLTQGSLITGSLD